MNSEKTGFSALKKAYNLLRKYLKSNLALFTPFLIFAFFELFALILLYLAPRVPFKLILGPPIKTLWSEAYLHYPNNFLLLPKLAYLARIALAIVIGSLLSATAISMAVDTYHQKSAKFKKSLFTVLKNYASFFIITFITVFLFYIVSKLSTNFVFSYFISGHKRLLFLGPNAWIGPILFCLNFILAIFIQAIFIYAIPIIIIENEKLFKAILKSFVFFKRSFLFTLILVGAPMLIFLPISILNNNIPLLINKFFPEIILLLAFINIIIGTLIIDPIVTFSTALFYLERKKNNNN